MTASAQLIAFGDTTICRGGQANLRATVAGIGGTTLYTFSQIPYEWDDIKNTGTQVVMADDDVDGPFPIGFTFCFLGKTYTQFYIGSNGWVGFSASQPNTYTATTIPNTGPLVPKNCIMGPWEDWDPSVTGGKITYQTLGLTPNRRLVVSWDTVNIWNCPGPGHRGWFQIVIHEESNIIQNNIKLKPNCNSSGPFATQGVHGQLGTLAYTVPGRNFTLWTVTNESTKFEPKMANSAVTWYNGPTVVGTGLSVNVSPPVTTLYKAKVNICNIDSTEDSVLITVKPPLDVIARNDTLICNGASVNLTAVASGGRGFGYEYSWNQGLGFGPVKTVSPSTTTTYRVIVKDSCTTAADTDFVTILVRTPLNISVRADTTICKGQSLPMYVSGTGGDSLAYTFTWDHGLGSGNYLSASPSSTTQYKVTLTDNCTLLSAIDSVDITVRSVLNILKQADTTICIGQSATLDITGVGGYSPWHFFTWDHGLGPGLTKTVNPDTTTTYRIVLQDFCTVNPDTDFITVTVRPALNVSLNNDTIICKGQTFPVTAIGNGGYSSTYNFAWNNGIGNGASKFLSPDTTTIYRVILTDNCTSISDTEFIEITVRPPLDIIARNDTIICNGRSVILSAVHTGGLSSTHLLTWNNGLGTGFTKTVSPNSTTTYRVILTDNCTSKSDTGFTTVFVRSPLTVLVRTDTTICKGQSAQLYVSGTGGDSLAYTFTWGQGIGPGNFINVSPENTTTYSVVLQDNCTLLDDTGEVIFNVRPSLDVNAGPDTTICKGQYSVLHASAAGGDSTAYTYFWDHGLGFGNFKNVLPDVTTTYRVILKDNCTTKSDTDFITVTVRDPLDVLPRSDSTICRGQSIKLFANGTGGVNSYNFNWNQGLGFGQNHIVTPQNTITYRVVMTDNCTLAPDTGFVTITVRAPLDITPRADTTICKGQSVNLFVTGAGGNNPNYIFNWSNGLGSGDTKTVSPSVSIIYRVIMTDNCTVLDDTGFVKITVRDPLDITPRLDTTICIGQSVNLTASGIGGFSPQYLYTWDNGLGTGTLKNVSPSATTNYRVILTDNCTTDPDTGFVRVNVRNALSINTISDSTICKGQSRILHANATGGDTNNYTFTWDNGLGAGAVKLVNPTVSTTYRVILTDHCTSLDDTSFVTITVRSALTVTPRTDTTICRGQSLSVFASGAGGNIPTHTFTWSNGVGTGSSHTVSPGVSTVFRVVLSDNCTAKPDTGFVNVTVRPSLKVNAGNDTTICIGQSATLNAAGIGGFIPQHTFAWNNGLGNGFSKIVNPEKTTTYRVLLTDLCTSLPDSDLVTVFVRKPLNIDAGKDDTICYGQSYIIKTKSDGGFSGTYNYIWDNGLPADSVQTVSPLITNTYRVILKDNCTTISDTDFITINVRDPLHVDAGNDTLVCYGSPVELIAIGSGGYLPDRKYLWDNALGTGAKKTISADTTLTYSVQLSDGCSIVDYDTIVVNVEALPLVDFKAEKYIVCMGDSVGFKNQSTYLTNSVFNWNFGDSKLSALKAPVHTYKDTGAYTVTLKIVSELGCNSTLSKNGAVNVKPLPVAVFNSNIAKTTILNPQFRFKNNSSNAIDYIWDFGDGKGFSTELSPVYTYEDTGTFTVSLITSSPFQCLDTTWSEVRIDDYYLFFIPNAFTPNPADQLNKVFEPKGNGIITYTTEIFNRWGQMIFRSTDPKILWNGKLFNDGPDAPAGVYSYSISVTDFSKEKHYYKGTITLLR